ncbi:DUF6545 domain-containing protein [Nonomuraea dietziae]|uniref:DUF6545 domain-containing protein n=1 Tax=Nonomuraea dietziae TaxID=65515 RepID=A0A7W5YQ94_9ACTN|nr:DUF6545 domain-containing protein [Nonomuraea dietziae]MBB3726069.1 hypothetical protein [Nonomuraea dietziae]
MGDELHEVVEGRRYGGAGRDMAALRKLRPLWDGLTGQYPDVALPMEATLKERLLWRVLEIRDGMLNLTSVVAPPESDDPDEVAQWVADALGTARAGRGPASAPTMMSMNAWTPRFAAAMDGARVRVPHASASSALFMPYSPDVTVSLVSSRRARSRRE